MPDDLRQFIKKVADHGELKVVEGADWDLEIGMIGEAQESMPSRPLLLFDKIKGSLPGYRVALNVFASNYRTALGLGLPTDLKGIDLVRAMKDKLAAGVKLVPPIQVESGPVKENIMIGDQVDLLKFPIPKWHALDGGRYIGTGSACVLRDPDGKWINVATYRVQVHSRNTATVMIAQGHHGRDIQKKYWDRGQNCPIAVACGQEPILWAACGWEGKQWGLPEYDFAGGLAGEPVKVTRGVTTDLPIPANAEIVLEGEIVPPSTEMLLEGPFGEHAGYYASAAAKLPTFRVKSVCHRNDPIIQGNPPSVLPSVWTLGRHLQKAASLWDELEKQVGGIKGVWAAEQGSVHGIMVISIKQDYSGHAKHAGLIAAGSSATRIGCRYVILVDDDIDPSNITDVLWAVSTRCDPYESIDIVRGCYGSIASPFITPEKKAAGQHEESRAIVNACRPYHWMKKYPPSVKTDPEKLKLVRQKWADLFK